MNLAWGLEARTVRQLDSPLFPATSETYHEQSSVAITMQLDNVIWEFFKPLFGSYFVIFKRKFDVMELVKEMSKSCENIKDYFSLT